MAVFGSWTLAFQHETRLSKLWTWASGLEKVLQSWESGPAGTEWSLPSPSLLGMNPDPMHWMWFFNVEMNPLGMESCRQSWNKPSTHGLSTSGHEICPSTYEILSFRHGQRSCSHVTGLCTMELHYMHGTSHNRHRAQTSRYITVFPAWNMVIQWKPCHKAWNLILTHGT